MVMQYLPRKTQGTLKTTKAETYGWGIHYEEGFDTDTFIALICVFFFSSSFLFLMLWSVLKMDVQGASGVAAYMLTACSIIIAWVVSRVRGA